MQTFPKAVPYGSTSGGGGELPPEPGRVLAARNGFTLNGQPWSWRGMSAFRLYHRFLMGEDVDPFLSWARSKDVNVLRVLGFIPWAGKIYGSSTPGYWERLPEFALKLNASGLKLEWTVFAGMQEFPDVDQRSHLLRVLQVIGGIENVFVEICNEPWQNGCDPEAIFSTSEARPCPMAYGNYHFSAVEEGGIWVAKLKYLDYITNHNPRDADAWSRKAKDNAEYRDGAGNGSEQAPLWPGSKTAVVGDEPMGTAEAAQAAGRQRSTHDPDFFWYHANAHINGSGSTVHGDFGLEAVVPNPSGDQERCVSACALAWGNIDPAFQHGSYTRGGLPDLPLKWEEHFFPEQTSRIYGRILGNRAVAVGIKPNAGWVPEAVNGWRIVKTVGPQDSLVLLER